MANLITGNSAKITTNTGSWYSSTGAYTGSCWSKPTGGYTNGITGESHDNAASSYSVKYTQGAGTDGYLYLDVDISSGGGGGKFTFSFWMRTTTTVAGGTGVRVEIDPYISTTAQTDKLVNETILDAGDVTNWTPYTITTPFIPKLNSAGAAITLLRIRLRPDGITGGVIYFDDFSLENADALKSDAMLIDPIYQNVTTSSTLGVTYNLWENPLYAIADGLSVQLTTTTPSGTQVVTGPTAIEADGVGTLSLDVSSYGYGSYQLKFETFKTGVAAAVVTQIFDVSRVKSDIDRTYYADHNNIIRGGDIQFHVGAFYAGTSTNATGQLDDMADAGMDSVMYYGSVINMGAYETIDTFVEACGTNGLKNIFCLKYNHVGVSGVPTRYPATGTTYLTDPIQISMSMINRYKDNENILAWYICDESTLDATVASIADTYHYGRELDPNHPFWCVQGARQDVPLMKYDNSALTRNYGDIHGTNQYPLTLHRTLDYVDKAMDVFNAGVRDRPIWIQIELPYKLSTDEHYPTQAQMVCEAAQGICGGATGIFFYGWQFLVDAEADTPGQVAAVTAAVADIRALQEIALAPLAPYQATCNNANIVLTTRMYNGEPWILATNPTSGAITATYTVDAAYSIDTYALGLPDYSATEVDVVTTGTSFAPSDIGAYGTCCYRLYVGTPTALPVKKTVDTNNVFRKSSLSW